MYYLPIIGVIGEDFNVNDLLMHLNAAKNEQVIKLVIDSPGGYSDKADEMKKLLEKENKIYYSTNSGDIASAAVELALVAPKENRTFDPSKGQYLIHMPFLSPENGGAVGTAEEIQEVANEMKRMEKSMAKYYQDKTGTSANILTGFMNENVPLTEEQIQTLGFATIIKPSFKAVAFYKKDENMENKEVIEKLGILEKALNKITAFIRPKSLMIQDVNGTEIDFGPDIADESQIALGITAMVNGAPADGEYVLPSGNTLVFTSGNLTEIIPHVSEEMQKIQEENKALQDKLTQRDQEFEAYKQNADGQLQGLKNEFLKFKNQFSDGDPIKGGAPDSDPKPSTRKAFKSK